MAEELNENFVALGLDNEAEIGCDTKASEAAKNPTVYRSVSSIAMTEETVDPVVYRSLKVSDSCPSVFDLSDLRADAYAFGLRSSLNQGVSYNPAAPAKAGMKRQRQRHLVSRLRRPFSKYVPAPVYALADVASSDSLVEAVFSALAQGKVDVGEWDESHSSISCKVVVDSGSYRFDVYILELDEEGKRDHFASHIVEVQRISSMSCAATWSAIVDSIMTPLSGHCFSGYFSAPSPRPAFGLVRQSSSMGYTTSRDDLFSDLEDDDDEDLEIVEDDVLEAEYNRLLAIACDANSTTMETRLEVVQLLARMSTDAQVVKALLKAEAISKTIQCLQAQVLIGSYGDITRAFCTLLSNLADRIDTVETTVSFDLAAHTTMHVLRAGDASNHLDLELLREAARALSIFSRNLKNKHPLMDQVREAASTCAMQTKDSRLASHAFAIIQNTYIAN